MANDPKDYIVVSKPYDGGPAVFGPFTYADADRLLKAGAAIRGQYHANCGYWSNLPCWWIDDTRVFLMKKLDNNSNPKDWLKHI